MTVSRPRLVRVGDQVRVAGELQVVQAVTADTVWLVDVVGTLHMVKTVVLTADPTLELLSSPTSPARLPPSGLMELLPAPVAERARWWERHIVEVLTGLPPDAVRGASPKPEYDPARRSLRQRELAKVAELEAAGEKTSLATVKRLRLAYERDNLLGLVDARSARRSSATGRTDERIVEALRRAIAEETGKSTGTVARLRRRVEQILHAELGAQAPSLPSAATFYRLAARLSAGKHTFGSAKTRRSLAKAPPGPFGTVAALRPGEWMHIDSTPIDVRVVTDDGLVDRAELTWLVDLATRSIPAAVLRPTTKAVDAAVLLAKALTPEPMRPGWSDALRMARSVLPHRRLTEVDERLEQAAARPVIVPETIVCDNGRVYVSATFRSACRSMGINFQPTHKGSPWENGVAERSFDSVATLFAQYVAGYVGRGIEQRGEHAEAEAVWSIVELQALLDEWIVAVWQRRPHEGLRDPVSPDVVPSPNEKYAALIKTAGYVPVPLGGEDFVELLPAVWRTINSYGIRINRRTYDCQGLNPHRRQHSGITARGGRWEVHFDPYDVTRVWVRDHPGTGWITVPWRHLASAPAPFGELAWQHARSVLTLRGTDRPTEVEIATVAAALLDRAEAGPPRDDAASRRLRRVAGRTRATAVTDPRPPDDEDPEPRPGPVPDEEDAVVLDNVIPLPIFDARKEAERWRW